MSGLRFMRVSNELVTEFLQGRGHQADTDLPADAKVIGVSPRDIPGTRRHCILFLLESDEWEPTAGGERTLEITPTYTRKEPQG